MPILDVVVYDVRCLSVITTDHLAEFFRIRNRLIVGRCGISKTRVLVVRLVEFDKDRRSLYEYPNDRMLRSHVVLCRFRFLCVDRIWRSTAEVSELEATS